VTVAAPDRARSQVSLAARVPR